MITKKKKNEVTSLIPIKEIDFEKEYFIYSDGTIMDFIQINPKDIKNLDDDERRLDNSYFEKFYKLTSEDIKIWALNFPEDTTEQKKYFSDKIQKSKNPMFKELLDTALLQVEYLQENYLTREFYMQIFCETEEEYRKTIDNIQSVLGMNERALTNRISLEKKVEILYKINNKNRRIDNEKSSFSNKNLISKIQPEGGIFFEADYARTGVGYETCIHTFKFPDVLDENWLMNLCRKDNTITTIDLYTLEKGVVQANINKSIGEQDSRSRFAQNYEQYYDAELRKEELRQLYDEISRMGEVVKMLQIRIYVYAMTREELESRCEKIINDLGTDEYKSAIFLNEMEEEWKSQYLPYRKQCTKLSFEGNPFKTEAIAGGNPFYTSELRDPNGNYMGATPSGGSVLFDEFHKSKTRLQYHCVAIGLQRSGKSTYLKKRFEYNAARGNFIRCFDVTGEFKNMTREYGGKVINFDGSEGMLNWLEIKQVTDNEFVNYARHIAKVQSIYRSAKVECASHEMNRFHEILDVLYEKFDLKPHVGKKITKLPVNAYPTLTDLINTTLEEMERMKVTEYAETEKALIAEKMIDYDHILDQLKKLKETYGKIFDGITSIENVMDEQIITYDLSNVKELEDSIFTAILINLLSLSWDNCVTNGIIMKEKWESGQIDWEDVVRFLIIIDESHRWVNTSKPQVLEMIDIFMREAPKFFGSLLFASHSIRDFFPTLDGSGTGSVDARVMNQLKNIFELTQYKVLFHQESSAIPMLDVAFGSMLTVSQKNRIPLLGQGECILCIANEHNIEYKVFLTEKERVLFAGGA